MYAVLSPKLSATRGQPATTQSQPAASSSSSGLPQTPANVYGAFPSTRTALPMGPSPKMLDISSLMSPPEALPYDTFNPASSSSLSPSSSSTAVAAATATPASGTAQRAAAEKGQMAHPPLSPPISPFAKTNSNINPESTSTVAVQDPILYPRSNATPSPPDPLFSRARPSPPSDTQRLVDEHVATRPAELFERGASPPQREEYELALYFKSEVMKKFMANPRGWLRQERRLLAADRKTSAANGPSRFATLLPARHSPPRQQQIRSNAAKVQKPKKPKQPKQQPPRPARTTPTPVRSHIRVKTTATPDEPRVRTVAPNREDKDFNSLPDYSPPTSSLPNKANSLKVDWKGNPLDLSNDPHAWLLHADEMSLAASLRLDCATYLTSKRRIFIRRLECSRIGKEFRKTDAQQACKIDVNKASKLWTAFEKVGWLDPHWMASHAGAPQPLRN